FQATDHYTITASKGWSICREKHWSVCREKRWSVYHEKRWSLYAESPYRLQLFGFEHWKFTGTILWQSVSYIDTLLLLPILLLLYKLIPQKPHRTYPIDKDYTLLDDTPITKIDHDSLSRKDFAAFVAKYIQNVNSSRSFAIGINAKWGDGKTSFQEMVGSYVKETDPNSIIFSFNPWRSLDEKRIILDFFDTLSENISIYNTSLAKEISSYGKNLIGANQHWWTSLIQTLLRIDKTQANLFEGINKDLLKIKRKVVIFIDDVDRLSKKEIMEIVKLIRSSANFTNTVFVVGFDQEYIHEALSDHNEYGSDDFLEKIFQIQFDLSHIPPNVIVQKLKEILEEMLPDYKAQIAVVTGYQPSSKEALGSFFLGTQNKGDFIPGILKNLRDVKRFANFFTINFRVVATEVDFEEYFYLALVRYKFPRLIKKIISNEKSI
ncbi:MAG: P-loop NTPase fold protein, partial [Chryseotalea sp.]